jgi:hypothetical protein
MPTRKTLIGWSVAVAALAGILFFPVRVLEVRSRRTDSVISREPTAPGEVIRFTYIHSIENIPVEGIFSVEDDGLLRLVETRFPSYGAGLPSPATGRSEDGKWMVAPGGQRMAEFSFYVSPINRSSLRTEDQTLDLNRLIEPGDVVAVAVRRHPFLLVRWGRLTGR